MHFRECKRPQVCSERSSRGPRATHPFFHQIFGGCSRQVPSVPQDSGVHSVTRKVCFESWVHWRAGRLSWALCILTSGPWPAQAALPAPSLPLWPGRTMPCAPRLVSAPLVLFHLGASPAHTHSAGGSRCIALVAVSSFGSGRNEGSK